MSTPASPFNNKSGSNSQLGGTSITPHAATLQFAADATSTNQSVSTFSQAATPLDKPGTTAVYQALQLGDPSPTIMVLNHGNNSSPQPAGTYAGHTFSKDTKNLSNKVVVGAAATVPKPAIRLQTFLQLASSPRAGFATSTNMIFINNATTTKSTFGPPLFTQDVIPRDLFDAEVAAGTQQRNSAAELSSGTQQRNSASTRLVRRAGFDVLPCCPVSRSRGSGPAAHLGRQSARPLQVLDPVHRRLPLPRGDVRDRELRPHDPCPHGHLHHGQAAHLPRQPEVPYARRRRLPQDGCYCVQPQLQRVRLFHVAQLEPDDCRHVQRPDHEQDLHHEGRPPKHERGTAAHQRVGPVHPAGLLQSGSGRRPVARCAR